MYKRKKWYERKKYIHFKPSTLEEWGQRVWDKFQEELDRRGYNNSTCAYNYLIGVMLMEMVDSFKTTEQEAFDLIKQKIENMMDEWEEENR